MLPIEHFAVWLASGERGVSSEAIVSQLTGHRVGYSHHFRSHDYPHDADDLRRCVQLLDSYPAAQERLSEMRSRSPQWAALVDAWPQLVFSLEQDRRRDRGTPAHTSELMRAVLAKAGAR